MRSRVEVVLLASLLLSSVAAAATFSYHVAGDDPGPWPGILSSIGLTANLYGPSNLFIVRAGAPGSAQQWLAKIEQGAVVVLEGDSDVAAALGIHPARNRVVVRSIVDQRAPKLGIVWEKPVEIPVYELPANARLLAWERWDAAPVIAAVPHGSGAALWLALPPGIQGYERFPYLLQALADLGIVPPFRSRNLWAFFDSAYRSRVDLDYFARRWRASGIAALHVAAWHYFESGAENDAYLRRLIDACHRNAILVYAWLELPHVSERFWAEHPEWREKTALLQDARLDWRKLINLANPAAHDAAARGVRDLLQRFDWDGVNLAELYFESLEGAANAARFTPMNDDVRRDFEKTNGFDPVTLFQDKAPESAKMRAFLDYRAALAGTLQARWIAEIEAVRRARPDLDLVLTHVDDRFDQSMKDAIGADAARVLPLLDSHDFTFMVEDPATVWNLGPQRYTQIADRYRPLTNRFDRLAIDINIVERYQDVYPTSRQTGIELFQLVHFAAKTFPRVALYFENSIAQEDLALLPASAAAVDKVEFDGARVLVASANPVGVLFPGPASVNGRIWPVRDADTLWLPSGLNRIEPAAAHTPVHVLDFNGRLKSAHVLANGVELAYDSTARAFAVLPARPRRLEVDGVDTAVTGAQNRSAFVLALPRGQHLVTIEL